MVRYGTPKDINDVLNMLEECKIEMRERNLNIWNDTYPTREIIENDLKDNNSIVYELDGKVVAFLAIYPKSLIRMRKYIEIILITVWYKE